MMDFAFQYFVGKNCGLRDTYDPRAGAVAGFYNHALAMEFAEQIHDGMNWTLIFNTSGKVINTIAPSRTPE